MTYGVICPSLSRMALPSHTVAGRIWLQSPCAAVLCFTVGLILTPTACCCAAVLCSAVRRAAGTTYVFVRRLQNLRTHTAKKTPVCLGSKLKRRARFSLDRPMATPDSTTHVLFPDLASTLFCDFGSACASCCSSIHTIERDEAAGG